MTEIARLKAQLVTVKNKKLKTAPCVKCGYFSDVSIAQNLQALKNLLQVKDQISFYLFMSISSSK